MVVIQAFDGVGAVLAGMINRRLLVTVCLLVTVGGSAVWASQPGGLSVDAAYCLNRAVNIMQRESINRAVIDWEALRATAMARAAGAQTYAGTYPAIEAALQSLRDGHSYFTPPSVSSRDARTFQTADTGRVVAHRFGYIASATWAGDDPSAYAARLGNHTLGRLARGSASLQTSSAVGFVCRPSACQLDTDRLRLPLVAEPTRRRPVRVCASPLDYAAT